MKFLLSFTWANNPFGLISKLSAEKNTTPYIHTQRPELEKFMNQIEWEDNSLQEEEEQCLSISNS